MKNKITLSVLQQKIAAIEQLNEALTQQVKIKDLLIQSLEQQKKDLQSMSEKNKRSDLVSEHNIDRMACIHCSQAGKCPFAVNFSGDMNDSLYLNAFNVCPRLKIGNGEVQFSFTEDEHKNLYTYHTN